MPPGQGPIAAAEARAKHCPDMTRWNSKWFGPTSTSKQWTVWFAKVLLSIRQSAGNSRLGGALERHCDCQG